MAQPARAPDRSVRARRRAPTPSPALVGRRLSEVWGQQVVVENRRGAGANIGAQLVAQSDPDGYTLFITSVPHATNRFLYRSLGYDPVADFAPVTLICMQPNIMVVPNASPAKSVLEFVAHAKANAGKISYGSGGVGTSVHLSGELFKRMTGIEMTHVPYRGSAPALQDVIAGRLDLIFDNITPRAAACQERQRARLGGDDGRPGAGGPGLADHRRGRRAGLRRVLLVRVFRAGQDPCHDHQEDERGHHRSPRCIRW